MGMSLHRPIRTSPCAICRRRLHRATCEEGSKCMPPDPMAGAPAGVNAGTLAGAGDAAEKSGVFTSS
eukprot:1137430-Pyramimonas_sp.AAC.1